MYTHGHHESVLRSHRWRTAANSAAYLLPSLASGMSLLDVGCGPGTITADLAALVAPGRVTAVEVAPEALELARTEVSARGQRTVDFVVSDVHALDFPDATFDVVHAHQVLQHVADPVAALREMRRVCKPGGTVAARDSDYAAFTWYPAVAALDEWLALYQTVARANGGGGGNRRVARCRSEWFRSCDGPPKAELPRCAGAGPRESRGIPTLLAEHHHISRDSARFLLGRNLRLLSTVDRR